jgi:hypothetical protein
VPVSAVSRGKMYRHGMRTSTGSKYVGAAEVARPTHAPPSVAARPRHSPTRYRRSFARTRDTSPYTASCQAVLSASRFRYSHPPVLSLPFPDLRAKASEASHRPPTGRSPTPPPAPSPQTGSSGRAGECTARPRCRRPPRARPPHRPAHTAHTVR